MTPLEYQTSKDLRDMLGLLLHLGFGDHRHVALLAADFAERTLPHAGKTTTVVLRCVQAVRDWASNPTEATLRECRNATNAAYAAYAAYAAAYAAATNAAAAAAAAYAAAYAATNAATNAAAYAAAAAVYATNAAAYAAEQAEQNWQIAHTRHKYPLTLL